MGKNKAGRRTGGVEREKEEGDRKAKTKSREGKTSQRFQTWWRTREGNEGKIAASSQRGRNLWQ
jgi:hypothetical protein